MSPPSQPSKVTRVNLCTWDLESHVVWDDPTHDAHLNKFEEDMIIHGEILRGIRKIIVAVKIIYYSWSVLRGTWPH